MQGNDGTEWRYFLTYSGVKLPLRLASELQDNEIDNRNTYFRAAFDEAGRMALCQKMVYGEVEMEHRYNYYPSGAMEQAVITMAGDTRELRFTDTGMVAN